MPSRVVLVLAKLMLLITFSACSILPLKFEEVQHAENPIIVKLNQGYLADDVLHLRFEVEAFTEVDASTVFLKLEGLKGSEIKETQIIPISSAYDKATLLAGTRVLIPLTLARANIDHFDLTLFYGEEGRKIAESLILNGDLNQNISQITQENKKQGLEIIDFRIEEVKVPCTGSSCSNDIYINIYGRIRKKLENKPLSKAKLAYRIEWVPDGGLPKTEESGPLRTDEKLLSFGDGDVPKEGFSFEVKGNDPLPVLPGGRFMPSIRVLSYE